MLLKLLLYMVAAPILSAFGGSTNIRMKVTTNNYCNRDLVDADGNPAPCGISQSMETYGLTLPGMEDGILTTREDIIIATDGQVSVKAMPNYPSQYIMTVHSAEFKRVEQLYDHQSLLLSDTFYADNNVPLGTAMSKAGLIEQGWVYEETDYSKGTAISKFSRKGPEGVDPIDGTNYTAIYQSGLMPDTWVLYFDESTQQPVKLLAVATYVGSKIFQESIFEEAEHMNSDMTVEGATQAMYDINRVDHQRRLNEADENIPLAMPDYISEDFLPERSRVFFDDHKPVDWMSSRRSLRQDGMSRGIEYFTIEKNSAADIYFHALSGRRLAYINFQFPKGCNDGTADPSRKYCLYAKVNASLTSIDVEVGMTFVDITRPDKVAFLRLSVSLRIEGDGAVLDLSFEASGCAKVLQYGAYGASVSINICISGHGTGSSLLQPDKRTFYGEAAVSVTFVVSLPVAGDIINWTIYAEGKCTAKPHGDITAYGKIGTEVSLKVAGASASVDFNGHSVNNDASKWEYVSNANFEAFVGAWVFKKTWKQHWVLWQAGPAQL